MQKILVNYLANNHLVLKEVAWNKHKEPKTWNLFKGLRQYNCIGTIGLEKGRLVPYTSYEPHVTNKSFKTWLGVIRFINEDHEGHLD